MNRFDVLKSLLWSVAILVVNVAISIAVVAVYAHAIAPGHDAAFYEAAAGRIAPWSSVAFGGPLFFLAALICGRRRRDRNAVAFAISIWGFYAAIDTTVVAMSGNLLPMVGIVTLSLVTKLVGSIAGALLATRSSPRNVGALSLSAPRP